jgi:hypothetical protein
MKEERPALGLKFNLEKNDWARYGGDKVSHISVQIKTIEEGKITNFSHSWLNMKDNEFYNNMTFTCQMSEHFSEPYGFQVAYKDVYLIESYDLEKMARTMKRVQKGLERLYHQFGDAKTFEEWILRVAKVLKIKAFIFGAKEDSPWYSENEYRFFYNPSIAKGVIQGLIKEGMEHVTGQKAEAI